MSGYENISKIQRKDHAKETLSALVQEMQTVTTYEKGSIS